MKRIFLNAFLMVSSLTIIPVIVLSCSTQTPISKSKIKKEIPDVETTQSKLDPQKEAPKEKSKKGNVIINHNNSVTYDGKDIDVKYKGVKVADLTNEDKLDILDSVGQGDNQIKTIEAIWEKNQMFIEPSNTLWVIKYKNIDITNKKLRETIKINYNASTLYSGIFAIFNKGSQKLSIEDALEPIDKYQILIDTNLNSNSAKTTNAIETIYIFSYDNQRVMVSYNENDINKISSEDKVWLLNWEDAKFEN